VILLGFAAIVGVLTSRQVRGQFNDEVSSAAQKLQRQLGHLRVSRATGALECNNAVHLSDYASAEHAQIRIFDIGTGAVACTQTDLAHDLGAASTPAFPAPRRTGTYNELGYRVDVRSIRVDPAGDFVLLYGRPYSDVDHTLARVRVFLILGVLGGTILALLAGLATAGRAMRPIRELTAAAREIERTRDPSQRIPHPESEDEVAELARTLEGMLAALGAARSETFAMLDRQREFVADASHELRTPLTSVLANLELLADELDGEQADSAKSALRSTRRMRRLVGDLLLLARADAKREQQLRPTDLGEVLTEASSELGPLADDHDILIDAGPAPVNGVRDDLHRMALNLLENGVRHTPPGTQIHARSEVRHGEATLVVEDNGPGIDPAIAHRVFERFVRGGGDGGRGSGLGLAIVQAVAESHGGAVRFESSRPDAGAPGGTRFTITLPAASERPRPVGQVPAQTSTTTGSTIGRRRSRS
jgi:two-component system, OmpR family, sensor kinase